MQNKEEVRSELNDLSHQLIDAMPDTVNPIVALGAIGRVATAIIKQLPVSVEEKMIQAKAFGETLLSTVDPNYSKEALVAKLAELFASKPTKH